jgi:flagellar motility protein MotE (MotC chaperone)
MTSRFPNLIRSGLVATLALIAAGTAIVPSVLAEGAAASPGSPATAAADAAPRKVRVIGPDGTPAASQAPVLSDVERYCTNIADPAKDARAALQTKRLQDLEAEVGRKVDELEAKRREYQDWLQQRQAFIDSTSSVMLDIYTGMKPDAAALQLAGIDRQTAASLIAKMKPRTASAIMAEIPAPVAAEITRVIVQKTNKTMDVASAAPGQQG